MLKIIDIKENLDGSAIMKVDMSEDVMQMLLERAINDILKEKIEELKNGYSESEDSEFVLSDLEREEDIEMERYVGP